MSQDVPFLLPVLRRPRAEERARQTRQSGPKEIPADRLDFLTVAQSGVPIVRRALKRDARIVLVDFPIFEGTRFVGILLAPTAGEFADRRAKEIEPRARERRNHHRLGGAVGVAHDLGFERPGASPAASVSCWTS